MIIKNDVKKSCKSSNPANRGSDNGQTRYPCDRHVFSIFALEVNAMRTLQIAMPDVEYARLGIQNDILDFSELEGLIERDRLRKMQDKCISLAEKYGLSVMTMDEITAEVKAYRVEKRARQNAESNY